ncbi:SurA-like protein [Antricoccus suffuscus]|uniref:SurA-like protein n=1 Tax=Antricoccus suffuscus TaxID=1629062 RepID=A0A2T1A0U9_9ACTN|nr:SurA N-terminal domain-containing protein [Antricoccus suffuscus]PRZ41948.1 SurA-like protein [Antricoccus suffuscus]
MAASARRRLIGGILGLFIGAAGLSACSNSNDIVAQVGSQTITVTQFDKAVQEAYSDPVIGKKAKKEGATYRQTLLTQMIQSDAMRQIAKKQGIANSAADIKAFEKTLFQGQTAEELQKSVAAGGTLYTVEAIHEEAEKGLVSIALGERSLGKTEAELTAAAAQTLAGSSKKLDLRYVLAPDAEAEGYLNELKAGTTTLDKLGAALGPATDGSPQPLEEPSVDLSQQPAQIKQALAGVPQGGFAAISSGQGTTLLVQVAAITNLPADQLQAQAQSQAQQQISQAGLTAAAKLAKKLNIKVNPRYGTLQSPSQDLPSITGSSPSTFKTPPAKKKSSAPAQPAVPGATTGG